MYERIIKLIGEENLNKIKNKTVCIVGLGGVGGFATEAIVRSGVGNVIIVDYDNIDISNLNRQIITNQNNIGNSKVQEMQKRIKSINPNCNITIIEEKIDSNNINLIFQNKIDYLIDACDTITTKEALIIECIKRKIKIISSMGTGNKLNPTLLEICDIRKTSYDPIAKKIRKFITDNKIKDKIPVVYSKEQNPKFQGSIPSMIFVPATAGLLLANYVIRDIINNQ